MPARFVFQIRPLTLEEGFELVCDGMLQNPLSTNRLYEAVVAAVEMGLGREAEIQILDTQGSVAEVLPLSRPPTPCPQTA